MKVEIESNLYIESDGTQFMVKQYSGKSYRNKNTGKDVEAVDILGYYPDLQGCVKRLLKLKLQTTTATNLNELLEDVNKIEKYIKDKVGV